MTHRREMAITSRKMPTSHTCHHTDEPIMKDQWRGTKPREVSLSDPSAFIVSPVFQLLATCYWDIKGVSPQTAPSFMPPWHTHLWHKPCLLCSESLSIDFTIIIVLCFILKKRGLIIIIVICIALTVANCLHSFCFPTHLRNLNTLQTI